MAQITRASDVKILLDFMLHLLRDGRLSNLGTTVDINRHARRFMLKIIKKTPVMPESLIVTGINVPAERDYISRGGFGYIFKGELRGNAVAMKVLYRADSNIVSLLSSVPQRSWIYLDSNTGFFSGSIDVAIPQSRICAAVFRNL